MFHVETMDCGKCLSLSYINEVDGVRKIVWQQRIDLPEQLYGTISASAETMSEREIARGEPFGFDYRRLP